MTWASGRAAERDPLGVLVHVRLAVQVQSHKVKQPVDLVEAAEVTTPVGKTPEQGLA